MTISGIEPNKFYEIKKQIMKKQIKKFETLTQMNDVNLIGGFSTVLQYSLLNGNPAFAANNETKGNNCQAMNCVGCGSPTNSATQCTSL